MYLLIQAARATLFLWFHPFYLAFLVLLKLNRRKIAFFITIKEVVQDSGNGWYRSIEFSSDKTRINTDGNVLEI